MKKFLSLICLVLSALVFVGCKQTKSTDFYVFELSGHVKSVTTYITKNVTSTGKETRRSVGWERGKCFFDENGVLSSYEDDNQQAIIERDKQGNIISIDIPCEGDGGYTKTYTWGENGLPISEVYSNCLGIYHDKTFIYSDSTIVGTVEHNCDEGIFWDVTSTYKTLSTDSNGNWTKRLIVESNSENSDVEFSLEERTITYYSDNKNSSLYSQQEKDSQQSKDRRDSQMIQNLCRGRWNYRHGDYYGQNMLESVSFSTDGTGYNSMTYYSGGNRIRSGGFDFTYSIKGDYIYIQGDKAYYFDGNVLEDMSGNRYTEVSKTSF